MGIVIKPLKGIGNRMKLIFTTYGLQALKFTVLMACLACKYYWRWRCRQKSRSEIEERTSRFKGGGSSQECAICLSNVEGGEEGRELACKHSFHRKCVDAWLMGGGSCPICRRVVLSQELMRHYGCIGDAEEICEIHTKIALFFLSTLRHRNCVH